MPVPRKAGEATAPAPLPSRRKAIESKGDELPLPDCPSNFLLECLFEVGPVMAGAMGAVPITWQELQAWQLLAGIRLQPWECRLLVRLSREFAGEAAVATSPECPPPYRSGIGDGQKAAAAHALSIQMRAMVASQQQAKAIKRKKAK